MTKRVRLVQVQIQAVLVIDDGENLTPVAGVQPMTVDAARWQEFKDKGFDEALAALGAQLCPMDIQTDGISLSNEARDLLKSASTGWAHVSADRLLPLADLIRKNYVTAVCDGDAGIAVNVTNAGRKFAIDDGLIDKVWSSYLHPEETRDRNSQQT